MAYYGTAVMAGVIVGVGLLYGMYLLINRIEEVKFKTYIRERNDATGDIIKTKLDDVLEAYNEIADKTNTMIFKRRANELRTLIAFIKSYKTNN